MSQTFDFTAQTVGTFLDAIAGVTVLIAPANKFVVNTGKTLDAVGGSGFNTAGKAVYGLPAGSESIESLTLAPNGLYQHSGGLLRASVVGTGTAAKMLGYRVAVGNNATDFGIVGIMADGSLSNSAQYYQTLPSSTLPVNVTVVTGTGTTDGTFAINPAGTVVRVGIFQNSVQLGAYNYDNTATDTSNGSTATYRASKGTKYGVFTDTNALANSISSTSIVTGYVAGTIAPTFNTSIANCYARVSAPYTLDGSATKRQAGASALVYSLTATVAGVTINSATGLITVNPTTAGAATTITVQVNDPDATAVTQSFQLTVHRARVLRTSMEFLAFNVPQANLTAAQADGFTGIDYGQYDFNGGSVSAGQAWDAARIAVPLKGSIIPGYSARDSASLPDWTSDALHFLQDTTSILLASVDEPLTADRTISGTAGQTRQTAAEFNTFMTSVRAIATSNSLAMRGGYVNLTNGINRDGSIIPHLQSPEVDYIGMDEYPSAYTGHSFIVGTQGGGYSFTSTNSGMSAYNWVQNRTFTPTQGAGVGTTVPISTFGAGYICYLQLGQIGSGGAMPTVAQNMREAMSAIIHGATDFVGFQTYTDTPFTAYNFNSIYRPLIAEIKRRVAVIQGRGKLFSAAGGRTKIVPRNSAVSTSGNSTNASDSTASIQTGATTAASWASPVGNQMQGGFEAAEFYSDDGTTKDRMILNLTNDTYVLNDATWGISGLSFAPMEAKYFAGTDAAFSNNLLSVAGWASHTAQTLATINNLLPDVAGSPRTITGRSITAGEVTANANASGILYGATLPTVGDGTGTTGGIAITLTEPKSGGGTRVTNLKAAITP